MAKSSIVLWIALPVIVVGAVIAVLEVGGPLLYAAVVVGAILGLFAVKRARITTVTSIAALVILVGVPSSATGSLPLGSLLPILAALTVQLIGIARAGSLLSRPPFILWAVVFLGLQALVPMDPFYALILPVALMQYTLVWSTPAAGRTTIRNWVIGIATAEGGLAVLEALTGSGPLLGVARTIDANNPLIPGLLRAQGTLGHPLVLALLLLVGLALVFAARDLKPAYRLIAGGIILAGSVFTGSTTTTIVAAALIGGFLLLRASIAGRVLGALALVIVTMVVVSGGLLTAVLGDQLGERATAHRWNAVEAIPNLFTDRPLNEVLLGSPSIRALYDQGVLINDGFYAIDNQVVTLLASTGLIGLIAATVFAIGVFVRTKDGRMRVTLLVFLLAGLSFDFTQWYVGVVLLFTVAGIAQTHIDAPARSESEVHRIPVRTP